MQQNLSSCGLIELIRNALPAERRLEASYVRLRNSAEHAVNVLDLGLGRRSPLPREKTFIENFLATLLPVEDPAMAQLLPRAIARLYQIKSDLAHGGAPNLYQAGLDQEIDAALAKLHIEPGRRSPWWRIADEFMRAGEPALAERAQRHASPLLEDLARVFGEPVMAADFTPELIRKAQRALEAAIERYPLFARLTRLDLGPARVIAIDLNEVARDSLDPAILRANALMFMIARHLCLSRIAGEIGEVADMDLPDRADLRELYAGWWRGRYTDIAESPKRLCMDEYHLTGGVPAVAAQVLADARVGRKWGLEIVLASQLLRDFAVMASMASTVMILNADSREIRQEAKTVFGFSDAVETALKTQVHGPQDGRGATFLARFMLREEERWALLDNALGPRMLWALTTRAEDRQVREALYARLSVNEALRLLAARFPDGTAIELWRRVAALARPGTSIAQTIAIQLMSELIATAPDGEAALARRPHPSAST